MGFMPGPAANTPAFGTPVTPAAKAVPRAGVRAAAEEPVMDEFVDEGVVAAGRRTPVPPKAPGSVRRLGDSRRSSVIVRALVLRAFAVGLLVGVLVGVPGATAFAAGADLLPAVAIGAASGEPDGAVAIIDFDWTQGDSLRTPFTARDLALFVHPFEPSDLQVRAIAAAAVRCLERCERERLGRLEANPLRYPSDASRLETDRISVRSAALRVDLRRRIDAEIERFTAEVVELLADDQREQATLARPILLGSATIASGWWDFPGPSAINVERTLSAAIDDPVVLRTALAAASGTASARRSILREVDATVGPTQAALVLEIRERHPEFDERAHNERFQERRPIAFAELRRTGQRFDVLVQRAIESALATIPDPLDRRLVWCRLTERRLGDLRALGESHSMTHWLRDELEDADPTDEIAAERRARVRAAIDRVVDLVEESVAERSRRRTGPGWNERLEGLEELVGRRRDAAHALGVLRREVGAPWWPVGRRDPAHRMYVVRRIGTSETNAGRVIIARLADRLAVRLDADESAAGELRGAMRASVVDDVAPPAERVRRLAEGAGWAEDEIEALSTLLLAIVERERARDRYPTLGWPSVPLELAALDPAVTLDADAWRRLATHARAQAEVMRGPWDASQARIVNPRWQKLAGDTSATLAWLLDVAGDAAPQVEERIDRLRLPDMLDEHLAALDGYRAILPPGPELDARIAAVRAAGRSLRRIERTMDQWYAFDGRRSHSYDREIGRRWLEAQLTWDRSVFTLEFVEAVRERRAARD